MNFKSSSGRENFKKRLEEVDYAVFDFDGTMYPGLFLFDLSKKIFEQRSGEKLDQLNNIAISYKNGKFEEAYKGFVELLKGENRTDFQNVAADMISNSYKHSGLTVKKLREDYGIKSYLISLTSDFIADEAVKRLGLEKAFSVGYSYKNATGKFSGNLNRKIDDPQKMKEEMLSELKALEQGNNKFICFFDSSDDLPISKLSELKVGVNPKPDLLKQTDFDVILKGTEDPWKEFYNFI